MAPGVFEQEPKDGSVGVFYRIRSYNDFSLEERFDGWRLRFNNRRVGDFLQDMAGYVKLSQPPSDLIQDFYINQLILQLKGECREIHSVHFNPEELIGKIQHHQGHSAQQNGITLRFADQQVVNNTFLDLLPFNRFHKNSPDPYDIYSDGVRLAKLLSALGVLDKPTLSYIEEQMPSLKHPDLGNWDNSGNPRRIVSVARDQLPSAKSYG